MKSVLAFEGRSSPHEEDNDSYLHGRLYGKAFQEEPIKSHISYLPGSYGSSCGKWEESLDPRCNNIEERFPP